MDSESLASDRSDPIENLPVLCLSIFDGLPLPMALVVGVSHFVRYANPAFYRFAGKNADAVIGLPFSEIVPSDELLAMFDKVYRTGQAENYTAPERSGAPYWSYTIWPVLGADVRPVGIMIQVTETARLHERSTAMNQELLLSGVRQHELTEVAEKLTEQLQSEIGERRRMEQVLVNTEKLAVMARFALMMAHEINNPLEAITNLMFLLAPLQSSSEAEGYMRTLEEQVKGLNRISTQMLKFHRDSNKPMQFALRALVRDVLDFYHPQADRRGVIVDPRIETEGRVAGFRTEIVQVLTNLLLNAIDATSVGGHVIVHLYPAPSWLCRIHNKLGYCISIADSGGGIDPQHKAKIFEPFFTTKGDRGTGLGLWVSLGIVTGAGGSIRVRSTRRAGRSGTCFSVFLPAEQAERKNS